MEKVLEYSGNFRKIPEGSTPVQSALEAQYKNLWSRQNLGEYCGKCWSILENSRIFHLPHREHPGLLSKDIRKC